MADNEAALDWNGACDKRSYYRLFGSYVLALFATGIATVSLAVLAFNLAGDDSGTVIGVALSLKMFAYVIAAPVLTVLTDKLPRKQFLIALHLVRAGSLILLPFVTAVWQVYLIVFVFAVASATFGFVYLALVPYLLGSEGDYTRSLARSRIATELEGPVSPLVAGGLMLALGATEIFVLAAAAFAISAMLIQGARLPVQIGARKGGVWQKLTYGPRMFIRVAEFRAVIALDVVVALATAMVMVNTIVIVHGLQNPDRDSFALAFFAFGLGSIIGAFLLPLALPVTGERRLMMSGAVIVTLGLIVGVMQSSLIGLLILWALLGLGVVWAQTPVIYLIRRLAAPADLQTLFAAQMAIANGCLLVAYPIVGWLGVLIGMGPTFVVLGALAGIATLVTHLLWRD